MMAGFKVGVKRFAGRAAELCKIEFASSVGLLDCRQADNRTSGCKSHFFVASVSDGKSPAYPSVTLRMDFRDPNSVGTFVYHCHLLEHEDGGMMGAIRVEPARATPAN